MNLENEVIKNASKLDKIMDKLLERHKGKYVTYHNGSYFITETFKEAIEAGETWFNETTGFVVREVTDKPVSILPGYVTI